MRISRALVAASGFTLPLAACGDAPVPPTPREVAETDESVDLIECALGEGSQFGRDCSVERVSAEQADGDRSELIVRHPDGGFRRFVIAPDASGLVVADGADAAVNALEGNRLDVRVADDRYRFPARTTGGDDGRGDGAP